MFDLVESSIPAVGALMRRRYGESHRVVPRGPVAESQRREHGFLFHALIEGLNGRAKDAADLPRAAEPPLHVPGIGARTTQRLVQHFGSVKAVKEADAAALAAWVLSQK